MEWHKKLKVIKHGNIIRKFNNDDKNIWIAASDVAKTQKKSTTITTGVDEQKYIKNKVPVPIHVTFMSPLEFGSHKKAK